MKNIVNPSVIFFDWDNTLTNGWLKLLNAMNLTLKEFNMSTLTLKQYMSYPSVPQREQIKILFGKYRKDVENIYWTKYQAEHKEPIPAITGLGLLLMDLKQKNIKLCILSNQKGTEVRRQAATLKIDNYFEAIIGDGDTIYNKPNPKLVYYALKQLKVKNIDETWLIGDSITDIQTAIDSGIKPIIVKQHSIYKENLVDKNIIYLNNLAEIEQILCT